MAGLWWLPRTGRVLAPGSWQAGIGEFADPGCGLVLAKACCAAAANSSSLDPDRRSTVWTVTPARSAMTGRDTSSYGRSANKARAAATMA